MEKLIDLILEYVEPDEEIGEDSLLKNDCGLSSFDMVCLVESICQNYNVNLDDNKVRDCRTVGELSDYIKLAKAG